MLKLKQKDVGEDAEEDAGKDAEEDPQGSSSEGGPPPCPPQRGPPQRKVLFLSSSEGGIPYCPRSKGGPPPCCPQKEVLLSIFPREILLRRRSSPASSLVRILRRRVLRRMHPHTEHPPPLMYILCL